MRPGTTLIQLAVCLASVAQALSGQALDSEALVARQDNNDPNDRSTITQAPSKTSSESAKETKSTGRDLNTAKPEGDDNDSKTGSSKGSSKTSKTSKTTRTQFAADAPAGGVSMQTPATLLEPTPLYGISDTVTFGWNYTSLQGKPTAVDVLITNSVAKATWTLTANMSFATSVKYVWDSAEQAGDPDQPFLVDLYTLIIKDSDAEVTDLPEPGYLGAYSRFTFGLYERAKATPFNEWECTACSAAPSLLDRPALGLALTMSLLSVLSFTWFVSGLGLH